MKIGQKRGVKHIVRPTPRNAHLESLNTYLFLLSLVIGSTLIARAPGGGGRGGAIGVARGTNPNPYPNLKP